MSRNTYSSVTIGTESFDGYDDGSGNIAPLGTVAFVGGSQQSSPVTITNGLPIQVADGDLASLGAKADSVASTDTGTFSLIALFKRALQGITSILAKLPALVSGRVPVDGSDVTQPISAASLPLPSGASTSAKQPALGTAGTASADVITIQGIAAMTALQVDGSAVTQPVSGTFWQTTQPVSGPLTDAQLRATAVPVTISGTITVTGALTDAELRASAVVVDGSGVTQPVSGTFWQATQPVSGPLTDTQLRATAVPVSGTFWQATQPVSGPLTDTQLRASAVPVTLTSTTVTGVVHIDDNSGSLTVDAPVGTPVFVRLSDGSAAITTLPISAASLPLPSGASTSAKQPALGTAGSASADVITIQGIASMTALKVDGSGVTQPVSGTFWQATQPVSGPLTDTQLRATAVPVTLTSTTITGTVTVTGALTDTQLRATPVSIVQKCSTPTQTTVAASATNVTLLASNSSRIGATIYNDSTVALYLRLGTTASTSNFTIKMAANSYYEVPFGYTGNIDGLWASASGNARITEIT